MDDQYLNKSPVNINKLNILDYPKMIEEIKRKIGIFDTSDSGYDDDEYWEGARYVTDLVFNIINKYEKEGG